MSSIFKTGTFGFSTVLSTPCDQSFEGTLFYYISNLYLQNAIIWEIRKGSRAMLRESLVKYLHHVLLLVNQSKGTLQQLKPHKFLQHYHPNFSYNLILMIKFSKSTPRSGDMPLYKNNNAPHPFPWSENQTVPVAIVLEEYFPRFINQLLQLPWTAIARWVTLA